MKNQEVDELIEQQREEIKGLMEWIAELEGTLDTAVSWDVEQLKVIHSLNEQNDQLRAELAAIKAQEPIYQFGIGEGSSSWNDISKRLYDGYVGRAEWATRVVYAAPVAKQVVMPERKWIPIAYRLPEIDELCLIRMPVCGRFEVEGAKYKGDGDWNAAWCGTMGRNCAYKVSHWMPADDILWKRLNAADQEGVTATDNHTTGEY